MNTPNDYGATTEETKQSGSTAGSSIEASSDLMFPRVTREPRLSDKVANMLLETIVTHRLQAGARLPSERELCEQFGVSRTVIREAVRALVAKGVVEARVGSGLCVASVESSAVTEAMKLFLMGSTLDYPKVHEVRAMLEVEIAGLAATRATDDDIATMREISARMETETDVTSEALHDVEFHRAIARATHNELHLLLLDSLGDALVQIRRSNFIAGSLDDTIEQHNAVLDRIAARDPDGARTAMELHLKEVEGYWRRSQSSRDAESQSTHA